jgi:hypothetical protein
MRGVRMRARAYLPASLPRAKRLTLLYYFLPPPPVSGSPPLPVSGSPTSALLFLAAAAGKRQPHLGERLDRGLDDGVARGAQRRRGLVPGLVRVLDQGQRRRHCGVHRCEVPGQRHRGRRCCERRVARNLQREELVLAQRLVSARARGPVRRAAGARSGGGAGRGWRRGGTRSGGSSRRRGARGRGAPRGRRAGTSGRHGMVGRAGTGGGRRGRRAGA